MDDKARGREIAKKFSRARKRITELNDEIIQLKAQRAERTREANTALAERDRARECEKRASEMFLATYNAYEPVRHYGALADLEREAKFAGVSFGLVFEEFSNTWLVHIKHEPGNGWVGRSRPFVTAIMDAVIYLKDWYRSKV